MAPPDKSAKAMSSRLMNMKFMQRGSASASPSTPNGSSEPAAKRQRLSYNTSQSSPATPASQLDSAGQSPNEDEQSSELRRKYASNYGESKWYLNMKKKTPAQAQTPLRIVSAGYSMIDASGPNRDPTSTEQEQDDNDTIISTQQLSGRRSFGKFNRNIEKQQDGNADLSELSSASSDEEEDDEDGKISDDPTGAKAMIAQSRKEAADRARAERKAKKKAESAQSNRFAEDRRKKEINLNKLTSISGSGGSNTPSRQPSGRGMTCYKCGEVGHISRECPKSTSRVRWP